MYLGYVDKYFANAIPVINSFRVIQWITKLINNYIRKLLKKSRQSNFDYQEQRSCEQQFPSSLPPFDEVYLLQKYR